MQTDRDNGMGVFLRENFHDAGGVIAFLRSRGVDPLPSMAAVTKWFQRGSVPGKYMLVLTTKG